MSCHTYQRDATGTLGLCLRLLRHTRRGEHGAWSATDRWLGSLVPEVPLEIRRVRHHILHDALLENTILPYGHHDIPGPGGPCLGWGRSFGIISALGKTAGAW